MTLPYERTRAVIETRKFLEKLESDETLPESVRKHAQWLLRHYPSEQEVLLTGQLQEQSAQPISVFSSSPYE